jgi:hypothetical protein
MVSRIQSSPDGTQFAGVAGILDEKRFGFWAESAKVFSVVSD